jgi:hypothetical protein
MPPRCGHANDRAGRSVYESPMTDTGVPAGGVEVIDPVWNPWQPDEVAGRLASVDAPWYVAAGWALDLWRGRQRRAHADIEIGIPLGLV